jgi:hypothetical protein
LFANEQHDDNVKEKEAMIDDRHCLDTISREDDDENTKKDFDRSRTAD